MRVNTGVLIQYASSSNKVLSVQLSFSNTPQPSPTSPLLRLPPGLRLVIYEELFQGRRFHLHQREHTGAWFKDALKSHKDPDNYVALLATCQKIHGEAKPVLYVNSTICFHERVGDPSWWVLGQPSVLIAKYLDVCKGRSIDLSRLIKQVRLLEIQLKIQQTSHQTLQDDCRRLDKVAQNLNLVSSDSALHFYIKASHKLEQTVFDQLILRFGNLERFAKAMTLIRLGQNNDLILTSYAVMMAALRA